MRDEIRNDSIEIVRTLREAKINVKMITGDIRLTAINVGKQLNLISSQEAEDEIIRKSEVLTFSSHLPMKRNSLQEELKDAPAQSPQVEGGMGNVLQIQQVKSEIHEQKVNCKYGYDQGKRPLPKCPDKTTTTSLRSPWC